MNNEYTIACLLDDKSIESIKHISYLEKNNKPHISLFQFKSSDEKILDLFSKELNNLNVSNQFNTLNIVPVENNIFLNIIDDSSLQTASDYLANVYQKNVIKKEYLSQIDFSKLNPIQTTLVSHYGIYWVKQFYNPHITLLYEKKFEDEINQPHPPFITVLAPNIYPIDSMGRIKNIQNSHKHT